MESVAFFAVRTPEASDSTDMAAAWLGPGSPNPARGQPCHFAHSAAAQRGSALGPSQVPLCSLLICLWEDPVEADGFLALHGAAMTTHQLSSARMKISCLPCSGRGPLPTGGKRGRCHPGCEFLILLTFNQFKIKEPYVACAYKLGSVARSLDISGKWETKACVVSS